jgi:hypothetical protein
VLDVVWIGETPGETAANDAWLVYVRADDGEREIWDFVSGGDVVVR